MKSSLRYLFQYPFKDVEGLEYDTNRKKALAQFESIAGIRFKRRDLLNLAFVHRSYANEQKLKYNNEKLEFLGDAVLSLAVSEYLWRTYEDMQEGDFTKLRSFVVSEPALSNLARRLHIPHFVLVSRGEKQTGGKSKSTILADAMEAVFGAYFLDSGFKKAKQFIVSALVPEIEKVLENKHERDYKSLLQQLCQQQFRKNPVYRVTKRTGPEHKKIFWTEVRLDRRILGSGRGKSKKESEQSAASGAYKLLCKEKRINPTASL